jgi:starch-binding outer membrane protein, SusD/RagB family
MKKLKYIYLALILSVSGCVDLEETPMSSLSPSNFYNTPAQVEASFAASMNAVIGYWYGYGVSMQGWFAVFYQDDQVDGGELNISVYDGNDLWGYHYKALLNLNSALDALAMGKVNASQEVLDQLTGQAKFLRAWNYFQLVRLYGGVPLYTEGESPILNPEARATVAEVYAQIVSDLTDASTKLPPSWPSDKHGRPTSGTANGLLAKVYITMATAPLNETSNYALAAAAAKKVMDAGIYSLVPDAYDVFKDENKYGPEMMWSFNAATDYIATDAQQWVPGISPFYGWGDNTAEDTFALQFPEQRRKDAYLVLRDADGVHYTVWDNWCKRAGIRKYLYGSLDDIQAYKPTYNIPILRYADVILLFAEATNMASNGPTQAAVDALNMVIDRANGNSTGVPEARASLNMSKIQFDNKVIQERSWELCFENDRWFDLCRKRILKEATQATQPLVVQNFSENDYLFAIPLVDLRLNTLLKQNPGYPDKE